MGLAVVTNCLFFLEFSRVRTHSYLAIWEDDGCLRLVKRIWLNFLVT